MKTKSDVNTSKFYSSFGEAVDSATHVKPPSPSLHRAVEYYLSLAFVLQLMVSKSSAHLLSSEFVNLNCFTWQLKLWKNVKLFSKVVRNAEELSTVNGYTLPFI